MTAYDSLHSLLDQERLLFHCDEWRTKDSAHTLNCLERRLSDECPLKNLSLSFMFHVSVSLSWYKAPIWGLRPDFYYCRTVAGLLGWGALSGERTGLSFTIAAGPRQRSRSRVRVMWNSRPYFSVSDSRLFFPSPPTTRRATVGVVDPGSTQDSPEESLAAPYIG
jgi:hypothetical protein